MIPIESEESKSNYQEDYEEEENLDIIGEFAKHYEKGVRIEEIAENYTNKETVIEEEDERSDIEDDAENHIDEEVPRVEQSFKETGVYKDIVEKRGEFQAR